MTNEELNNKFNSEEWYDNSKIRMMRGCRRKAYFQLVGPKGIPLATRVGDGANFGSSVHAAIACYYNNWSKYSEPERRILAARAFTEEWSNHFPLEGMQSKHLLNRGLDILDAYCEHYLSQDSLWMPVESELGFALRIVPCLADVLYVPDDAKPSPIVPDPFFYVGRIDGIFKKVTDDSFWLRETKTTSSAIDKRLRQLKFDHQPVGYVSVMRELQPQFDLTGFVGDVILVSPTRIEFGRDVFRVTNNQSISWKRQLIFTVQEWRNLIYQSSKRDIDQFHQDTERCFDYGRCSFYDLCDYGINDDSLAQFETDTWNPLLKRTPEKIQIQDKEVQANIINNNKLTARGCGG